MVAQVAPVVTMTLARALTVAPAGAVLATRPTSPVAHVYVGPLTRSRRFIPRAARPICGTRTRRLTVQDRPPFLVAAERRLCVSCSARLDVSTPPRRQGGLATEAEVGRATSSPEPCPTHAPVTRDSLAASYADLTPFDIALGAFTAETVAEVERLELLALLVVGHPACATEPVVSPAGKTSPPVDVHIARARTRIGAAHEGPIAADVYAESARRAKANAVHDREVTRDIRERDIAVLGHTGARDRDRRRAVFIDARNQPDQPPAATG